MQLTSKNILRHQSGMTLLEIIIVVTILASLLTILAGRVGDAQKRSAVRQTKIIMSDIATKLELYNTDCGHYPSAAEGFNALLAGGEAGCPNWGPEPYLKKAPVDAWNHPLIYNLEGTNFTIMSYGIDNKEGGTGYDKDIIYPE